MTSSLDAYRELVGFDVIEELQTLAEHVGDRVLQNISSPAAGRTVSGILTRILPLLQELGVHTRWDLMPGDPQFFVVTRAIHDALHGNPRQITQEMFDIFEAHTAKAASTLDLSGDAILVHDPQPLGLIRGRRPSQTWMWRCHLDLSYPDPYIWSYLKPLIESYDCSIFSMPDFAPQLSIPQYMIAPSIDPLSDRNKELPADFIESVLVQHRIDPQRPVLTQISRFDHLRDPLGVIATYRLVKKRFNIQLVLAGAGPMDDPETQEVLREVQEYAANDPDCHVIALPPSSDLVVNALVRASTVVLQKSIREGFGLTVSEALWKRKPVVGGAVGGIKAQIVDGANGFLVHSPEGAANRVIQLLADSNLRRAMGEKGYNLVKENFLITRHVKDYLLLMLAAGHEDEDTIYLGQPNLESLSDTSAGTPA
jgi:trehalose synthase